MKIAFTICTNNYLPKALVLRESFYKYHKNDKFCIILVDKEIKLPATIAAFFTPGEIIAVDKVVPTIDALSDRYNIVELCTAVKPVIFKWILQQQPDVEAIIYLDPDLHFYRSLDFIDEMPDCYKAFVTPHILAPIADHDQQPKEQLFLKYGIYNLGFLYLRAHPSVLPFLEWWTNHTFQCGFNDPDRGQFVDQLPLNLAPVFFDFFHVLHHYGMNVAPWNLQERQISFSGGTFYVNETAPLIFMHFSDFSPEEPLVLSQRNWYPRNKLIEGTTLSALYNAYSKKLYAMGHDEMSNFRSFYYKPPSRKPLRSMLKSYLSRLK